MNLSVKANEVRLTIDGVTYRINPDQKKVKEIGDALIDNANEFGKPYCPCQLEQTADTVCMCKKMKSGEGCCCELWVVVEDENNGND